MGKVCCLPLYAPINTHAFLVPQVFAPANLRAASQNQAYAALVNRWIEAQFTLRYTGGMVPDVHHMIAKGHGIFCNPCSTSAPAKLRLLYECAPLALIVEVRWPWSPLVPAVHEAPRAASHCHPPWRSVLQRLGLHMQLAEAPTANATCLCAGCWRAEHRRRGVRAGPGGERL